MGKTGGNPGIDKDFNSRQVEFRVEMHFTEIFVMESMWAQAQYELKCDTNNF